MNEDLFSRNGLSLDRLLSFLAVADSGSIAKSAPTSLSRQALVSRQIGELESFFGTELTVRRGKSVALSPAGERLAKLVRQQLQDLRDFHADQHRRPKAFRIGAGASLLEWVVIPALKEVRMALSGASLRLDAMRSHGLVEAVREGGLDFALVREDALTEEQRLKLSLRVTSMAFHLCASRQLLGSRTRSVLSQPHQWRGLPFALIAGGGQLDRKVREALQQACPDFTPAVECTSLLQVRELIVSGACAGVLPSIGMGKLLESSVVSREFEPLKDYGRPLVLHWNERQMRRRGIEEATIKKVAESLVRSLKQRA